MQSGPPGHVGGAQAADCFDYHGNAVIRAPSAAFDVCGAKK